MRALFLLMLSATFVGCTGDTPEGRRLIRLESQPRRLRRAISSHLPAATSNHLW